MYFVERFFAFNGGSLLSSLGIQLMEGKKGSVPSTVILGRLRSKCSADSAKLSGQEKEKAQSFSLGKVYSVIFHATHFTSEIKVWVQFGLF